VKYAWSDVENNKHMLSLHHAAMTSGWNTCRHQSPQKGISHRSRETAVEVNQNHKKFLLGIYESHFSADKFRYSM
jgi:hypothetical protein